MNSLQELEKYMLEISELPVNAETIIDLEKFIRFSPEKFADKINLERELVTKKVDAYKKQIHKKIVIYKKTEQLKLNWENYGKYNGEFQYGWDLDHIIPLSTALTENEVYKLNHYSNLQPLCSKVNRDIKKDKSVF